MIIFKFKLKNIFLINPLNKLSQIIFRYILVLLELDLITKIIAFLFIFSIIFIFHKKILNIIQCRALDFYNKIKKYKITKFKKNQNELSLFF